MNPAGARLLGERVDDLVGLVIWDKYPETVGSPFEEHYRHVANTGDPASFEAWYEPLGIWFQVRCVPHRRWAGGHLRRRHRPAADGRGARRRRRRAGGGGRGRRRSRLRGRAGRPPPHAPGRHQPGHDLDVRHRRGRAALRRPGRAAAGRLVHRQRRRPGRHAPGRRTRAPRPGDGAAHAPVRRPARGHQRRDGAGAGDAPRGQARRDPPGHRRDHPLDGPGRGGPGGAGAARTVRRRRLPAGGPRRGHRRLHAGQRRRPRPAHRRRAADGGDRLPAGRPRAGQRPARRRPAAGGRAAPAEPPVAPGAAGLPADWPCGTGRPRGGSPSAATGTTPSSSPTATRCWSSAT